MTVFTRVWDAAYEAIPPDNQNVSQGASRIRNTRADVGERLVVDHSWAGDVDDGMHKQVTLVDPLGAKPTQANDETYIYSKDVGGTAELFFEDEAGNEIQLTSAGSLGLAGQAILGDLTGDVIGNLTGDVTGDVTGNADTASAWATGRTITLTGDATGVSGAWTGSGNISFVTSLASNSVGTAEIQSGAIQAEMAISSVGDVGTFALLHYSGGSITAGNTVASGLSYAACSGVTFGAAAGTWRCMGFSQTGGTAAAATTLWLRVS